MYYLIRRTLISDDYKKFSAGDYIELQVFDEDTDSSLIYIGKIMDVLERSMLLRDVSINGEKVNGTYLIYYIDIEPESCRHIER